MKHAKRMTLTIPAMLRAIAQAPYRVMGHATGDFDIAIATAALDAASERVVQDLDQDLYDALAYEVIEIDARFARARTADRVIRVVSELALEDYEELVAQLKARGIDVVYPDPARPCQLTP